MFSLVLVICTVAVAVNAAPTQVPSYVREELEPFYKRIDANGDGIADLKEFQTLLQGFDTNKDGKVSLEELAAAFGAPAYAIKPVFQRFDANQDNYLEDSDVPHIVNMLDTDKNGQVTQEEFVEEYYKLLMSIGASF